MLSLWQDLRIAVRMLRRAPSVSIPAVLVLALGIGAATALYAVVYAMWLRPLPYPDPGRLVSVTTYFAGYKMDALLSPDYGSWQGTRSLGPLGAYSTDSAVLIAPEETLEVGRARVSGNLLGVLHVHAALGRNIQPADDSPGAARIALLSDGLWRERFGADRHVVGRFMRIDGESHTIIGVLPRGFRMPDDRRADLLTPLALGEGWLRHGEGGIKILHGIARLQPGIGLAQARAELSTRLAASRAQAPELYGEDVSLRVVPLHEYVVGDVRTLAIVLSGVVACILIIAGANVASLLVARAAGRGREMAVRVALGASAARIARLLLMEGLVLGLMGIAGGLALARALIVLMPRLNPPNLARVEDITLNGEILMAAIGAALLCSLAFSAAPILPLPRLRVRRVLVTSELALSLLLLVASALLLESLSKLRSIAPGFRTERLVTASVSLKGTRFDGRAAELRRELRERMQGSPGVLVTAFADALPPDEAARVTTFSRSDRPLPEAFQRGEDVVVRLVDAAYFEAMGIPLRQGRGFSEAESLVALVNRALADRYFAGESAIGKKVDGQGVPWKTIIGVVGDVRNDGLRSPTRPEIYLPMTEVNARGGGITSGARFNIVIRTAGDPSATMNALRGQLREMDRGLAARVRTMDERWANLQDGPRFQTTVFSGFAVLALVMACTGVYGVASHVVVARQREIGVRMALGARPADVQVMILREALMLAVGGVAIGIPAALAGSRLLAGLLYGVNPRDPVALAGTAALLILLALCASAAPAWRASRQDPAQTLRAE
jgi:putative ABC transport system permease protein